MFFFFFWSIELEDTGRKRTHLESRKLNAVCFCVPCFLKLDNINQDYIVINMTVNILCPQNIRLLNHILLSLRYVEICIDRSKFDSAESHY